MTTIAALVVGFRSSHEIGPMVESLRDSVRDGSIAVTVHVIDNSGDPAELARLHALSSVDRVMANSRNLGYGGGMNALASSLENDVDWLLICNPDIRFSGGSLEALVDAAARHPRAGLFGPLLTDESGVRYPSARAFPSIRTGVGHALFARSWPTNPWTARYHGGATSDAAAERVVDWLSGACLLVRPEVFTSLGGFDEGYFMYFEDVDLAWRLDKSGWETVYVPSSTIVHSGAHSTSSHAKLMRDAHHRSASRFMGKRYASWWLSPLRWAVQAGLFLRRTLGSR